MNNDIPDIALHKNQWLFSQIDIEFPTQESLRGRELYQSALATRTVQVFTPQANDINKTVDEICLVDFHKMTVMFALNQASQWDNQADRALILEFFTQIILSPEHHLYLGFAAGEVVASAVITSENESLLVSDLYIRDTANTEAFANQLIQSWEQVHQPSAQYWIES